MVRAILDGRKTQTRRVIKCACNLPHLGKLLGEWELSKPPCQYDGKEALWRLRKSVVAGDWIEQFQTDVDDHATAAVPCPYGQPGDVLLVKENAWLWCHKKRNGQTKTGRPKWLYVPVGKHVVYQADGTKPTAPIDDNPEHCWRLKIGRFLPRWAVRTRLALKAVRVERLQSIRWYDIKAEGISCPEHDGPGVMCCSECTSLRAAFRSLWESINGPESWQANSWIWVVSFSRVQP